VATSGLRIVGVYETVLYAPDPPVAAAFYRDVLGLEPLEDPDDLSAVFRLPTGDMLLIFNPQKSTQPGRPVPSHGSAGPGHIAFGLKEGTYQGALGVLEEKGIEIEREVDWGRGRSFYCRHPAGNSVELVDGDIWPSSAERN
jgi:catechol 2,3-dioxygenase-like lactoylglutathione lyase family enzyme